MKPIDLLPPDEIFGELFVAVQEKNVFPDSKTFVDCTPKYAPDEILKKFNAQKNENSFRLKQFVEDHFELPISHASGFKSDPSKSALEHVNSLWPVLTRSADNPVEGSSLIALPYPYIVPGGRFGEIYYWDSYFTMLGLQVSGKEDMIENMVKNFGFLIDELGFIPNGNRSYFATRSQPPFFALMVQLLKEIKGNTILIQFLPQLVNEYQFWLNGTNQLNRENQAYRRVVILEDGTVLNRYWDDTDKPRQESYLEDVELAESAGRKPAEINRHLRAACESGWDFTSRWLKDGKTMETMHAADIVPIDLNCLLYYLEHTISEAYQLRGEDQIAEAFAEAASNRQKGIIQYCWNEEYQAFMDFDFIEKQNSPILSAAMLFPLFFNIASSKQAEKVAEIIKAKFLKGGGLLTTIYHTGQQWDAPNGWAPLQWIAVKALDNYGYIDLAHEIAKGFINLCEKVYSNTGKFVEKYNVEDMGLEAGGGEYPVQDGFGWSNGVYLKLKDYLNEI